MRQAENVDEIHSIAKQYASFKANSSADPSLILWRHHFSIHYHSFLQFYHEKYSAPTKQDISRHRKTIGDTVMDVILLRGVNQSQHANGSIRVRPSFLSL